MPTLNKQLLKILLLLIIIIAVTDAFCSDETYFEDSKDTTDKVENVTAENRMITVQGEFQSKFPHGKFKEYLEVNLEDAVEKCEKYGCWYEDNFVGFLSPGCESNYLVDKMSVRNLHCFCDSQHILWICIKYFYRQYQIFC